MTHLTDFKKFKCTSTTTATTGSTFCLTVGQDIEVGANKFLQDFEDLLANDDDLLKFNSNNELCILEPIYSYLDDLFDLQELLPQSGQLRAAYQEEKTQMTLHCLQ